MFVYRYDYLAANECGINEHALTQMEKLGCKVLAAEPITISDCWIVGVEKEILVLPPYLQKSEYIFTQRR